MRRSWIGLITGLGILATASAVPIIASAQKKPSKPVAAAPTFEKDVLPMMNKYCVSCHASESAPGGIQIKKGLTATQALKAASTWQRIAKNVANKHMPPEGMPGPTDAQRRSLVKWVDSAFVEDCRLADPGKVTIRRLNREEYNNTVRDLLGVSITPADDFPSDDIGYGFDNIGDVLSMSPLLMEKYLAASEKLVKAAIRLNKSTTVSVEGSALQATGGAGQEGNIAILSSTATVSTKFQIKKAGWYRIRLRAGAQQAGPDPAKVELRLNRGLLTTFDIRNGIRTPENFDFPVKLNVEDSIIGATFINDYYRAAEKGRPAEDRNVGIYAIELVGPIDDNVTVTPFQKALIPQQPAKGQEVAEARKALTWFTGKAYRRPATPTEIDRLISIFNLATKAGEGYEKSLQISIQAVLCNPNFLYRVELDGAPTAGVAANARTLSSYELASRLSYFLWSSTPDDALLALAKSGDLAKPQILAQQVTRMLKDPKGEALVENFGTQWLQLRKLPLVEPDKKLFPGYNDELMNAMLTETTMFVDGIMREDRSIGEFIDAKYTYLNEPLAKHYGIAGVTGKEFRKVSLEGTGRGGVLTQASVLTVTSNPTRTSPTKRGKWILEQILGSPPPPPPPGVGDLKDDKHFTASMTLRQKMEEHRKNPACAVCHIRMDALGFGFENFDAVGKYRTKEGDSAIDSTATLPGGKKFSGASQLKTILMADKKEFARNFAEKMMIYALGRGVNEQDKCAVDEIVKKAAATDYKFSSILQGIVASDPFKKRKVEGATK